MAKEKSSIEIWNELPDAKKKGVEKELSKALDLAQGENESRQKFLGRMMKAGKTCDEAVWEKLSDPAQHWVNAAVDSYDDDQPFPDPFPKAEGSSGEQRSNRREKETDEMATSTKKGGGKAPATTEKKKSAQSAPTKSTSSSGTSGRAKMKAAIVRKPDTPLEKLQSQYGGKGGLSELTISSIRSDTLNTLRVADEAGFWKGPSLAKKERKD